MMWNECGGQLLPFSIINDTRRPREVGSHHRDDMICTPGRQLIVMNIMIQHDM